MKIEDINLINTAIREMDDGFPGATLVGIVPCNEVKGERQSSDIEGFEYEYVDQKTAAGVEDCYYGEVYLPIDSDSEDQMFLKIHFDS